jgi:hypothetical protein
VSQKPKRSAPAKTQNEYGNFTRLLDSLLKVPHDKIKTEIAKEKRTPKRKRAAVGHAYRDTD